MSVSVDPKQIDKLKQLESVLGLLQNPESYTRLLAEVQVTLKRYEEVSKRYATIEAADKYLQESKSILEQAKETTSAMYEKLRIDKAEHTSKVTSTTKDLSLREAAVHQKEILVAENSEKLDKATKDLRKKEVEFDMDRKIQMDLISKNSAELDKQRLDFADKAAKLAKIVAE